MSSRLLLELIDELPETSKFKQASERTFRVAEHDGNLVLFPACVRRSDGIVIPVELPDDAELIAEFVDWTHDRKIAARNAREMAVFRMEMRRDGQGYDVDLSGLTEPLESILANRAARKRTENRQGAQSAIRKGLFAKTKTKGGES